MGAGVWISIAALLVAIPSAIYARRSASEAKNANRIASHHYKLDILETARNFKHIFRAQGEAIDASLVYALLAASHKAGLYFTQKVSEDYSNYASAAYDVLIARDRARALESVGHSAVQKWEEVFSLVDRCREIENELLYKLELETQIVD